MYQGKFQNSAKAGRSGTAPKAGAPAKEPIRKQRRSHTGTIVFYSLLLAFILLFCVGLGIAMNALNNWLVRFEASQPTAQCQAVFGELFAKPDWELIHALSNAPEDISAEAYARYMEKKVGNTPLTYIETSAGLSGDKKYIVRCGSEKVATFTLRNAFPDDDIPSWQLGSLDIFYTADLSITVQAPPEYQVLVNAQELDESHVISTVTTKAEEYLPNDVHGYRMNVMAVHDLLADPVVHILDSQGNLAEVQYDSETQCYSVDTKAPSISDEHRQLLVDSAETYCKYMIGDAERTDLRDHFDVRSDIYRTITGNTTWMQNYASYKLSPAQITDYYCYSDEYFSGRVALTLEVTRKDGTVKKYELDNTFFLKKAGTQWLVWEMINADAQELVTNVRLTYVSQDQVIHTEMVDARISRLTLPEVTAPEGKTFTGWFIHSVDEAGGTTMELAFAPDEAGSVRLPAGTVLEPMTLYALYE